ncbi:aryl-alcohol oxidase-like protein [Mycena rosella]|uniref:Aryl-alcohol oxidase-like protein n=1 Tax=Mycena rosella TaxID=1033263 RepID=A0AAD7DMX0_MYCRO|nr:aryl-alcohol oxidase-like protein [Mycena rosella]
MKAPFLLLVACTLAIAKLVDNVADLPSDSFDFVVVGGGAAGNVIANRLSEKPRLLRVVLEAGISNVDVLGAIVPFFCSRSVPYDWNYTTVPQAGLNGQIVTYPRKYRGRILGGSSSINCLVYSRGSSEDFDRWAELSGDPGWSWDSLQPYIRKFDPAVHGFNGLLGVGLAGYFHPFDQRVFNAVDELSAEFPYNVDYNSGTHQLGIGWTQATIRGGERSSSATAYLAPHFLQRPNLHVLINAQVTRVLQTESLAFRAVEFATDAKSPRHRITARKEVILSAGSVGTPHILMHSGIGNASALSRVGIAPLHDLPSVGQNLSDHTFLGNQWQLREWNATRTGPLVDTTITQVGWLRIPDNSSIFQQFPDPAAGPHTAHYELLFTNGLIRPPTPPTGNFMGIGTAVVAPVSRGSITLNSSDPFASPLIDPALLSSDFDLFVMREAVKSVQRFVAARAWDGYIIASLINGTTDAELDAYIRSESSSEYHPVGTAAMSPWGARYGVVDPDLRVKGLTGLRVVDASVLPIVPAAHTQAAVYIFAERAADLIKAAWA